jgi:hypothetical protein
LMLLGSLFRRLLNYMFKNKAEYLNMDFACFSPA